LERIPVGETGYAWAARNASAGNYDDARTGASGKAAGSAGSRTNAMVSEVGKSTASALAASFATGGYESMGERNATMTL